MRSIVVGALVAALFAVPLASSQQAAQAPVATDADWHWFDRYQERAFDELMPMNGPGVRVAYRSYRDLYHDVMERHFTIAGPTSSQAGRRATVVAPVGGSIQKQLLEMHIKDRTASFESILARIAVRRLTLDEATCPAIGTRMDDLLKIAIQAKTDDDKVMRIIIHSVQHRIVVKWFGGTFEATLKDSDEPLARWAVATNLALLACAPRIAH